MCWEPRDPASGGWKSWVLLNLYCHIHPGEFAKLYHTSSPQPVVSEERRTHLLHQWSHERLWCPVRWDERDAQHLHGDQCNKNGGNWYMGSFAKDANNVPDPAHAVYPCGNSQKAWHWQLCCPTRHCRGEHLQGQVLIQLEWWHAVPSLPWHQSLQPGYESWRHVSPSLLHCNLPFKRCVHTLLALIWLKLWTLLMALFCGRSAVSRGKMKDAEWWNRLQHVLFTALDLPCTIKYEWWWTNELQIW